MKIYHPHRHTRFVPIFLLASGIPILLLGTFLFIANIIHHDEARPNDDDLRLSAVQVVEAQNAVGNLEKVSRLVDALDPAGDHYDTPKIREILSGGTYDAKYIEEQLTAFQPAISEFHRAATKSVYQDRFGANPSSSAVSGIPTLTGLQFVARLVALEAFQQANRGHVEQGLTTALDIVKIGHMMESGQGTVIEYLVGSATKKIGLSAIQMIGSTYSVPALQAKTIATALEQYRDTRSGLVKALKLEYAHQKVYFTNIQSPHQFFEAYNFSDDQLQLEPTTLSRLVGILDAAGFTNFYYFPHQSLRLVIEQRRKDIQYAQEPCATIAEPTAYTPNTTRHGISLILEPNAIGKVMTDIGNVALGGIGRKACDESLLVSVAQTSLAVSAYKTETKKFPSSLETMAPKYFSAVPVDPYSDKPLRYSQEKKMIYSVGFHHQDIGGSPTTESLDVAKNPSFTLDN